MKIKYLGTAAAEGLPGIYCECANCKKARKLGGKNIRSRSQALIDGKLLIDFPCDTYWHFVQNGISLTSVRNVLITHIHSDHFYPKDFGNFSPNYSVLDDTTFPFRVFGSEDLKDPIAHVVEKAKGRLEFVQIFPFEPFEILGYTVTAIKAKHGTTNPYLYVIEKDGKSLLYAHDTGFLPEESFEYLKNRGKKFDFVSLDCTEGSREELNYDHHLCLGWDKTFREQFIENGLADKDTIFCLNHFSHNGTDSCYDDFSKIAAKDGFLTSYDGMEIEF